MAHVVRKDPDAAKKFEIDWSPVIGAATITASSWTVPTGVTQTAASYAGKISDITISGGTLREVYELENSITDSQAVQQPKPEDVATAAGQVWAGTMSAATNLADYIVKAAQSAAPGNPVIDFYAQNFAQEKARKGGVADPYDVIESVGRLGWAGWSGALYEKGEDGRAYLVGAPRDTESNLQTIEGAVMSFAMRNVPIGSKLTTGQALLSPAVGVLAEKIGGAINLGLDITDPAEWQRIISGLEFTPEAMVATFMQNLPNPPGQIERIGEAFTEDQRNIARLVELNQRALKSWRSIQSRTRWHW